MVSIVFTAKFRFPADGVGVAARWEINGGFQTPPDLDARVPPRVLADRPAALVAAASDPTPSWLKKFRRDKAMDTLLLLTKLVIRRIIIPLIFGKASANLVLALSHGERVSRCRRFHQPERDG
jgi:hypothetical protein